MRRQPNGGDVIADRIFEDAKRSRAKQMEAEFAWGCESTESPIERIFLAQLFHPDLLAEFDLGSIELLVPPSGLIANVAMPPLPGLFVWPQIKIGSYRVDFIIGTNRHDEPRLLVVECDGHDFHEKTREQAQRDKARDRHILAQGYRLVRFTGSEIYRNPFEVATEALSILLDLR